MMNRNTDAREIQRARTSSFNENFAVQGEHFWRQQKITLLATSKTNTNNSKRG